MIQGVRETCMGQDEVDMRKPVSTCKAKMVTA